ncbi:hypothetical protein ACWGJ2_19785 [Streptomyces sp. NPDC054796]
MRKVRFQQLLHQRRWESYETFCHHYRQAAKAAAELDGNPKLASAFVSHSTFDRWMTGEIKGLPRFPSSRVLEHLFEERVDSLFGPPAVMIPEQATPHLAALESFRMADRQLGGGHVYWSVLHYLKTAVLPALFDDETGQDSNGEEAFRAAAVLTEMAGWMAHDAGLDEVASSHFSRALRLGQSVADTSVAANIKIGMSHLALQSSRAGEAAELARSGIDDMASAPPMPVLSARLCAMQARALGQMGEASGARRALEGAEEYLRAGEPSAAPSWVAPFDEAALASESASTLLDLGLLSQAEQEAERALSLRDATRARSRAFGQMTLAQVLIARGQVDAACTVGHEVLGACQSLGSHRISRRMTELGASLAPFGDSRSVRALVDRMAEVEGHRTLLLASLTLPGGRPS